MAGILVMYASQVAVMRDQLDVMQGTLQTMEENQRVAQKPMIMVHLMKDLDSGIVGETIPIPTKGGDVRFSVPYFITNIGKNPALGMTYLHWISTDSSYSPPADLETQTRYADDILFPATNFHGGRDQFLRQDYYDAEVDGKSFYRHFAYWYADGGGHQYGHHVVWLVKYDKESDVLTFQSIRYYPLSTEPPQ